jgi:hypothetical protein
MTTGEISKYDQTFYTEIRELLQRARGVAYRAVNTLMVNTYWQIGKRIVEQEQHGQNRAGYGDSLITNLSRYLSDTLGKCFSEANLKNMRQFYVVFPDFDQFSTHCVENSNTQFATHRVANLTWTKGRNDCKIFGSARKQADFCLKIQDGLTIRGRTCGNDYTK